METGVFGSPGSTFILVGVWLGGIGMTLLALAMLGVCLSKELSEVRFFALIFGGIAFLLLVPAFVLLPLGQGIQKTGDCFSRLPAATFAVDVASPLLDDKDIHVVIQGKDRDGEIVRVCANIDMDTVKDYPGPVTTPGKYWLKVEEHKGSGREWPTYTFVPVASAE